MPTKKTDADNAADVTSTDDVSLLDNPSLESVDLAGLSPGPTPPASPAAAESTSAGAQPRKVRFLRTLGTIDCRKCGIDVSQPPQEGEVHTLSAVLADVLLKRGLVTTA